MLTPLLAYGFREKQMIKNGMTNHSINKLRTSEHELIQKPWSQIMNIGLWHIWIQETEGGQPNASRIHIK